MDTGQRFGRLTVVGPAPKLVNNPNKRWKCLCECGRETVAFSCNLRSGRKIDCGRHKVNWNPNRTRHGLTAHSGSNEVYRVWGNMLQRCSNPKHQNFKYYGGRGITVCSRWRDGENGQHPAVCMFEDMGVRPTPRHTLERIDNDGPYSPSNCRWATPAEQSLNKRNSRSVKWNGQELPINVWSERLGIPYATLYRRLFIGNWEIDRAMSESVRRAK